MNNDKKIIAGLNHQSGDANGTTRILPPNPPNTWKEIFRKTYNDNEAGGSSRWLITPTTAEVMIEGFIEQAVSERTREIIDLTPEFAATKDPLNVQSKEWIWGWNEAIKHVHDVLKLFEDSHDQENK